METKVFEVRGAWRDLNCKGRGIEAWRKVWRGGTWRWISPPLPHVTVRSADRHCSSLGAVEAGEIVVEFSRNRGERCSVDRFAIVTAEDKDKLVAIPHVRSSLAEYTIETASGQVVVPDPLARS